MLGFASLYISAHFCHLYLNGKDKLKQLIYLTAGFVPHGNERKNHNFKQSADLCNSSICYHNLQLFPHLKSTFVQYDMKLLASSSLAVFKFCI